MENFLKLSAKEKRQAFELAEERMSLQAASVEKDFWVCWTLKILFGMPGVGEHLTFKGGTSLSKVWGLIERFSEDIDLIVDRRTLWVDDSASPEHAPSRKKQKESLEALMSECKAWVQGNLLPLLQKSIANQLGTDGWRLEVDPDVQDGQCLLFHYPGVFKEGEAGYVRPVVKIELGARSDDWPSERKTVVPYVSGVVPEILATAPIEVNALAAERTFWEKAMLLHEETFRPEGKARGARMARHYYDLWCLIKSGVANRAAADTKLFERVAFHREIFFRWSWVDYGTLKKGTLRLTPPPSHADAWRRDYEKMRGTMFFGKVPEFEEIMKVVGEFESHFNRSNSGLPSPKSD